jgi:hypothetical protein
MEDRRMKKMLRRVGRISVEMLRRDRSLRLEVTGTLSVTLIGDVSCIRGDVSCIRGDVSGISGNVSGIIGDVSGIIGDVSGVSGNVSDCEITDVERLAGVDIAELVVTP